MKIAITGVTSFLGSRFAEKIVEDGWDVTAIVRKGSPKNDNLLKLHNITLYELNMDEYYKIGELVPNVACFVHFAWSGTRGTSRQDHEIQETNYKYSLNAIKSIVSAGCKKVVLAGSQAEYGNCNSLITELTPCVPNTEYGRYKLKLFEDATAYCELNGAHLIEPRFFSMYGPGDYKETLIMSCLRNMIVDAPCELTACTQMWNFLYVDDAISAVAALCDSDCEAGTYNVGSDDIRILKAYIDEMKKITHSSSELRFGAIPYPATGAVNILSSIEKIKRATTWKPSVTFREGINRIINSLDV